MNNEPNNHNTANGANNVLLAGAKIEYLKPNLFQKIMYRIGWIKDPRYNGEKLDWAKYDEVGAVKDDLQQENDCNDFEHLHLTLKYPQLNQRSK